MHRYIAEFLSAGEHASLVDRLLCESAWQREKFNIFGKAVDAPRLTTWYGDHGSDYRYTGLDHSGAGWPAWLTPVRNKVANTVGYLPNFVVVNRYDHGGEHMGWHRDDEQGLVATIASLSLGETRRFRLDLPGAKTPASFELEGGSLLIFDGRQRHQLSKTKRSCGTRINLTFRQVVSL